MLFHRRVFRGMKNAFSLMGFLGYEKCFFIDGFSGV